MSNEEWISLKKFLVISDNEWERIKNAEGEMYRIWGK